MRSVVLAIVAALLATFVVIGAAQSSVLPFQQFEFKLGFKLLADQIPGVAGQPIENEWHNPENGDGLQRTSAGMMVWRKADNWTAFTDGSRTWINGPYGVQSRPNDQRFDWERTAAPPAARSAPGPGSGRPVLAFFYPWLPHADTPTLVQQARGAGIDGFIVSWMGMGDSTDEDLKEILDASRGTDSRSCAYFEAHSIPTGASPREEFIKQLRYIKSDLGSHPNYCRIGGKPALFVWNTFSPWATIDFWRDVRSQVDPAGEWHWNIETDKPDVWLEVFDGFHLFSCASWAADATATYQNMKSKADAISARTGKQKLWVAGAAPGWNAPQAGLRVDRQNGAYYSRRWDSAIASNPAAIAITSWNERNEGTNIEPMQEWGNLYLDITREKARQFRETSGG